MYQDHSASPSSHILAGSPDENDATDEARSQPPDVLSGAYAEAFRGAAGNIVSSILPYSEASPMALLVHLLSGVGNLIGPGCVTHAGSEQPPRLFALVVGRTATGRKGTAWSAVHNLLSKVDPEWASLAGDGLSSAEGLLASLQDGDGRSDDAGTHKRRFIVEPEFGQVLKQSERRGNTLSEQLRKLWDSGEASIWTRSNPLTVTGAHVSIVGHVTPTDLSDLLGKQEVRNGFINRFLIVYVTQSKTLPRRSARMPDETLDRLAQLLHAAIAQPPVREFDFTEAADHYYDQWRLAFQDRLESMSEHQSSLIARGPAHVSRLALIYSRLDRCEAIDLIHIRSAVAVWNYAVDSALHLVPEQPMPEGRVKLHRGRHSDKLVVALRDAGDRGLTFTEQTKLFGNNVTAAQLRAIRCDLEATGRITTRSTRNYHGPATQRSYLIQHAPPEQFDANEPAGVSQ